MSRCTPAGSRTGDIDDQEIANAANRANGHSILSLRGRIGPAAKKINT